MQISCVIYVAYLVSLKQPRHPALLLPILFYCVARAFVQFNEAFTSLFVVEMTIKIGLLGPVGYFSDGFNIFDFTITLLGLVEITIKVGLGGTEEQS